MTTFFAGDELTAAALEELTRDPYNQIASQSSSGSITNTESVSLTLPSATYKAGKAYEIWVGGGLTYSSSTAFSSWNIKKGTTTAGTTVVAYPRMPVGGHTNEIHLNLRAIFTVGSGGDVTTQLCLAVACNSSNTLVHNGSSTNPRHITVLRAGSAANWSNRPVLS